MIRPIFASCAAAVVAEPSLPFRSATIEHIQCGQLECPPEERGWGPTWGCTASHSTTTPLDCAALEQYKQFRLEAELKGFRHFLEMFDPNARAVEASQAPAFINDAIVRTLGGVTSTGRPVFLKMVYHGPKAMEELVHYDPHLVVGILGGSAGTTYDAFKLLSEAKKYGARVACSAERSTTPKISWPSSIFWPDRRRPGLGGRSGAGVSRGVAETGRQAASFTGRRHAIADNVMNYGGNGTVMSAPPAAPQAAANGKAKADCGCGCKGACDGKAEKATTNGHAAEVDFTKMTAAQKVAYHKARWDRILG